MHEIFVKFSNSPDCNVYYCFYLKECQIEIVTIDICNKVWHNLLVTSQTVIQPVGHLALSTEQSTKNKY